MIIPIFSTIQEQNPPSLDKVSKQYPPRLMETEAGSQELGDVGEGW